MARANVDILMTADQIAQTFGDRTVLDLEALQQKIIEELRFARLELVDGALEDQIMLDAWTEVLMVESRRNSDRIREIRKTRTESIGMRTR